VHVTGAPWRTSSSKKGFSDVRYQFLMDDGKVKWLKVTSPTGEFPSVRW
jgi:hypothetical protein